MLNPGKRQKIDLKRSDSEEERERSMSSSFSVNGLLNKICSAPYYKGQLADGSDFPIIFKTPRREAVYSVLNSETAARLHPGLVKRYASILRKDVDELNDSDTLLHLYSHQKEAIEAILAGESVAISTSTSSGKSLAFNLPVLSEVLQSDATALYLYPTKALAQDQKRVLDGLVLGGLTSASESIESAIVLFDGDSSEEDRTLALKFGRVILTNPDMLHYTMLPLHKKAKSFFEKLKFIVIDEAHCYRGAFGSHVASVIRRLQRIAMYYRNGGGRHVALSNSMSKPQFICCSATIGNPLMHAVRLVGSQVGRLIGEDGSPSGEKWVAIWHSKRTEGNSTEDAARIVAETVRFGGRVICFGRYRAVVEKLVGSVRSMTANESEVVAYRGGYSADERRRLESEIFSGKAKAVICTNALELGVDIGSLDAAVSLGFPGSVHSLWQQFGRAGRAGRDSLCILACKDDDVIDSWLSDDRDRLMNLPIEDAVLQTDNTLIVKAHIICADHELEIRKNNDMFEREILWPGCDEAFTAALKEAPFAKSPHSKISIRSGVTRSIKVKCNNDTIDELDFANAFFAVHEGAVHFVQGVEYRISELRIDTNEAFAVKASHEYVTKVSDTTNIQPKVPFLKFTKFTHDTMLTWGRADVDTEVRGFYEVNRHTLEKGQFHDLSLPTVRYPSFAVVFNLTEADLKILSSGNCVTSSIHAATHLLLRATQLRFLADKSDIRAECPYDVGEHKNHLLLYDAHNGGLGVAESVFSKFSEVASLALKIASECTCIEGCPRCCHIPSCSSYNKHIQKSGGSQLLELIIARVHTSD